MNNNKLIFSLLIIVTSVIEVQSQSYFANTTNDFQKLNFNSSNCECAFDFIALQPLTYGAGTTFTPDSQLIHIIDNGNTFLYKIDTITGNTTQIFSYPITEGGNIGAIASVGNGIFYAMGINTVYRINIVEGTMTYLGSSGYNRLGVDMTLYNGDFYYATFNEIIKLDTTNPSNSSIAVVFPSGMFIFGLTASHLCNSLLGIREFTNSIPYVVSINLLDGAVTYHCEAPENPFGPSGLTSKLEFSTLPPCENYIDLDCNDSSGATDADYNSPEFDCLSDGVGIADIDIKLLYDAIIEEMTIEVAGFVPDAPNEILVMSGSVAGINVSGSGTNMITLTNAGGARSTDFKDALRLILYNNTAVLPTAGLRTVEVQFTTESGMMSNVATAFIQVNELPLVPVDIGPDQEVCEEGSVIFDAGVPDATYLWSNSLMTQTITVGSSGLYSVTVSDGINCPNQDTAELILIPNVNVSLQGDTEICDNESATLTIITDSPFPLTVEISTDPGSPFTLTDVSGTYNFSDLPTSDTEYTITSVTSSQPACITLTDSIQLIDVYPTYNHEVEVSLCEGDSVFLGVYWETEAGVYGNTFSTLDGCDSVVTTTITILPAENIFIQATTCNGSEAGVFFEYIDNPNGCDTVIQTTVSLLPSDTTLISSSSCKSGSIGVFTQVLSNQDGCDSVIITTISLIPPVDTTNIFQTTCDSSALGVFQQLLTDQAGCDSLIQTTVSMAPADTSYINGISCDPASIGVFQSLLSNQLGCDSLVITNISAGIPDTSYFSITSCDSASLGVFEDHFISQSGCDSTVFTIVTYSASDSTFINSASCNPADTGVFVQNLINRFGCDSIVETTIAYAISHSIQIMQSTCDSTASGVFTDSLINQYGCDSIVTITVGLLPIDATELFSTTCITSQAGVFVTNMINQYGCDSIITLTVSLVAADTSIISFKTCDPGQIGSTAELFTGQDGCDSLVISETTLHPLPVLNAAVSSDYNGYAISCFGESDGSAVANVTGTPPFSYLWTTGSTDPAIANLPEGTYTVSITDGNGCIANDEILLTSPPEFSISLVVSQPDCFDQDKGSITVQQTGGIDPIRYSIDGINYQPSPIFNDLSGGTYQISVFDANDCEVKEIIWINVPLMVHVDLGDDLIILPGDTTIIQAIVNVPFDSLASITWSGLINPNCPDCLTQPVAPIITTTYSVTVTSHDGCVDEDAMTLLVDQKNDIYVPNIFSPNGDNVNDRLLISAGKDVERIVSFSVYDRWGDMVFEAKEFFPGDVGVAWDGRLKGRFLNPGVFAYRLVAVFKDGSSTFRYGDVTLLR